MDEDGIAPVAIAEGDGVRENPEGENEIEEVDDEEDEDEDDDEDDEDFEDEDDPHQAANGAQNNANDDPDIIEGGIAENDEPGKLAAEADIVSIFIFRCWAVLFGVVDTLARHDRSVELPPRWLTYNISRTAFSDAFLCLH
jgi:hypothetical protein